MGEFCEPAPNVERMRTDRPSNIGVLQTTVAELITVKEQQRELS